jgi:hypothetical protein
LLATGEEVVLIKACDADKRAIFDYCALEAEFNTYIFADIEHYGFDSEMQDVWVMRRDGGISGVLLRYHRNFIYYAKPGDGAPEEAARHIMAGGCDVIIAQERVALELFPHLDGFYTEEMRMCKLRDTSRLVRDTSGVILANVGDAIEIAGQYKKSPNLTMFIRTTCRRSRRLSPAA